MGLTFVAAGVSIPDILTSLAVAREGNTFALLFLFCLKNSLLNVDYRLRRYGDVQCHRK